ncbi:putative exported protein of unknown function [Rhodopseudomonas palustris TIE-1]|nr:putative exported protein of unknown function [Rhodopseudomonas palustris TIE-1]
MRLFRTIVAILIAASLVALPIGAHASASAISKSGSASSEHFHISVSHSADMSMDEYCPHDTKRAPSPTHGFKCPLSFCCVGASVALNHVTAVRIEFSIGKTTHVTTLMDAFVPARAGSLPFRPPRV